MAVGVLIVIVAVVLIVTLTGNSSNSVAKKTSTGAKSGGSSATGPSSAQAAALPELLCSGPSYVITDDGQTQEQLLTNPAALVKKYPSSVLSVIAPGCMAGSDAQGPVVIAFGPYADLAAACAAKPSLPPATYKVLQGSATAGLTLATCP